MFIIEGSYFLRVPSANFFKDLLHLAITSSDLSDSSVANFKNREVLAMNQRRRIKGDLFYFLERNDKARNHLCCSFGFVGLDNTIFDFDIALLPVA